MRVEKEKNIFSFFKIRHSLSSRKRQRLQIRLESLCIKRKGQKKSVVKDSVCIGAIRELFFDLRPVAIGSQDELWQGLSIFIF